MEDCKYVCIIFLCNCVMFFCDVSQWSEKNNLIRDCSWWSTDCQHKHEDRFFCEVSLWSEKNNIKTRLQLTINWLSTSKWKRIYFFVRLVCGATKNNLKQDCSWRSTDSQPKNEDGLCNFGGTCTWYNS
jgi:hypothetical protein